jgi:hypothetical protein
MTAAQRRVNATRQQKHNAARRERGLVPVTVWVPSSAAPELAAEAVCADHALRIGRLVNVQTGRMASIEARP